MHDSDVLSHVDEATGQISSICGLECSIGQTLPCTVGGDEVLHHRKALAEVRLNGRLDDLTDSTRQLLLRLSHEATHSGQLTHLVSVTTSSGGHHHVHRVEAVFRLLQVAYHGVRNIVVRVRPCIDDLVVTLTVGDKSARVSFLEACDLLVRFLQDVSLLHRHLKVSDTNADSTHGGVTESEVLQIVQEFGSPAEARVLEAVEDNVSEFLLAKRAVLEAELVGHNGVEQYSTCSRRLPRAFFLAILLADPIPDRALEGECFGRQRHLDFTIRRETRCAFEDFAQSLICRVPTGLRHLGVTCRPLKVCHIQAGVGQVVQPNDHVLRRSSDRTPIRRQKNVVRRKHEHAGFKLRFERERYVHRHLITVEVGVERRTYEGVYPDGLTLDQHRLKRLDAESVERWRTVQ